MGLRTARAVAFVGCALLAGCGFHLKAAARLSPGYQNLFLDTHDPHSDLNGALVAALGESGAVLRPLRGDGAVLEIARDESGRRVMSVSVRNVPTEYEVYYNVTYRVIADGRDAVPPTELTGSRVISYAESAQLAKEQEEAIIREALARDLAERIVQRLSAL